MEKTKRRPTNGQAMLRKFGQLAEQLMGMGNLYTIKTVLTGILIAGITMLLGMTTLLASAAPLGASFMLALNRFVPFSFVGLLASAFSGEHKIPIALASMAIFAIRTAISHHYYMRGSSSLEKKRGGEQLYSEPIFVRVILSVFAGFLLGVVKLIGNGYLPKDLIAMLVSMVVSPVLTYIFTGINADAEQNSLPAKTAVYAVMTAIVLALRDKSLFGFALSTICALTMTMWMSEKGGILRGGVTGILTGMAAGMPYAPAFAAAGLAAGMIWEKHRVLAVTTGTAVGAVIAFSAGSFTALRGVIPDMVVTSALLVPVVQMHLFPPLPKAISPENSAAEPRQTDPLGMILWKRETDLRLQCVDALSAAFSGLSEVCKALSMRIRRPGREQTRQLIMEVLESRCGQCVMKGMCWRGDEHRRSAVGESAARLTQKNGRCKKEFFPEEIQSGCRYLEKMVNEINGFYAELIECAVRTDKTEVFALEYDAMAKILEESSKIHREDWTKDEEKSRELKEIIAETNFPCDSAAIYGGRRKSFLAGGIRLGKLTKNADELREMVEGICGVPMNAPEFSVDEDYVTMSMTAKNLLAADTASVSSTKNGETINGDHVVDFENREGYRFVLLSDGMGSGYEAALTSKICGIFLEKLLGAGCSVPLSLEMLNNFIRNRNVESFATIDLLRIDLVTKEAVFIKSGAAPSYIFRDGSLFKVASATMPVGITREINAEEIRFALEDNDVVIMFSDGVAQSFDDGIWLTELICSEWEDDLETMADKIKTAAEMRNYCRDDITVCLTRVRELHPTEKQVHVSRETMALIE